MDKILSIIGIKTPKGIYITQYNGKDSYNKYSNLNNYKINGETPKPTFDNYWNIINEEPKIIEQPQSPIKENYRFILKDKSMACDKIPLQLQRDEVCYYEDYDWRWKQEYIHLNSLYSLEYDEIEQLNKIVEFTYEQIIEVDELKNIKNFDWEIYKSQWTHEGTRKVGISDLKYQLIDKIMFPNIYYQQYCPVILPSKTFYDIIRFYIKSNIDSAVAEITSDYDFCFTVKKKIRRNEPLTIKEEQLKQNGHSYAKPKFTTKTHQYAGNFIVFEMTHNEKKYQGYPILSDIAADNIEKLKEKVNNILKNLIDFINESVSICPCCEGTGVKVKSNKINLNEMIKW
jgi:hypothetical protein